MKLSLAQRLSQQGLTSYHSQDLSQGLAAERQEFLSAGSEPVGLCGYLSNPTGAYEFPSFSQIFGDLISGEFTYWLELVILIVLIGLWTCVIYKMCKRCVVDAPKTPTHLDKARKECSNLQYNSKSKNKQVKVAYNLDNMHRYLFDPSDAKTENILKTMQDESKIEEQVEAERIKGDFDVSQLRIGCCDRMCGATDDHEVQAIQQHQKIPTGPVHPLKWLNYGNIAKRNPNSLFQEESQNQYSTQKVEDEIRTDQQVACLLRLDDHQFAHLKKKMQKDLNTQSRAEFNTTLIHGTDVNSEEGKSVFQVEQLLFLHHLLQEQGHFDVQEFEEDSDFEDDEDLLDLVEDSGLGDEEMGEQM